jgi:hypothetical protein
VEMSKKRQCFAVVNLENNFDKLFAKTNDVALSICFLFDHCVR